MNLHRECMTVSQAWHAGLQTPGPNSKRNILRNLHEPPEYGETPTTAHDQRRVIYSDILADGIVSFVLWLRLVPPTIATASWQHASDAISHVHYFS